MHMNQNQERIKKFYHEIVSAAGYKPRSYMMEWLNRQIEELGKLPDAVDRSGISKGDALPVPKGKRLLALHEFVFNDLPLKRFAELYGLNYGTVRNWRNADEIFSQLISRYASDFIQQWVSDFMKCAESSKPDDFAKAIRMARESRGYHNAHLTHLPHATLKALKSKLKQLNASSDDVQGLLEKSRQAAQHKVLNRLIASYCGEGEDLPTFFRALFNEDAASMQKNFDQLAGAISDEQVKSFLRFVEIQAQNSLLFWGLICQELTD